MEIAEDKIYDINARRSLETAARRSMEPRVSKDFNSRFSLDSKIIQNSSEARKSHDILTVQEIHRLSLKLIDQCSEAKHNKDEIGELCRFIKKLPFDLMEVEWLLSN